jgi:hypothetical protein
MVRLPAVKPRQSSQTEAQAVIFVAAPADSVRFGRWDDLQECRNAERRSADRIAHWSICESTALVWHPGC